MLPGSTIGRPLGSGPLFVGENLVAPEQMLDPDAFFETLAGHCPGLPPGDKLPVRITRAEL